MRHHVRRTNARSRARVAVAVSIAAAAALCSITAARGSVVSQWAAPVDGSWTDPTEWTTNPQFPQNGSPTAADTYQAFIAATGANYTVTLDATPAGGAIGVDFLGLNTDAATINATAGMFRATQGLEINAGTFNLRGGTLSNTIVSGSGGQFTARTGVLDGVTLQRDALIDTGPAYNETMPTVRGGLTFDGGGLSVIQAGRGVIFNGTQTLGGNGTLSLNADHTAFVSVTGGSLTIAPGVTMNGAAEVNNAFASLINKGTMRGAFTFEDGYAANSFLVNQGLIEAPAGASIYLEGVFDNSAGTIRANGGHVTIGNGSTQAATYTTAQVGNLEAVNGGSITLTGLLNNTGATLTATPTTGNLDTAYATISGGTLASSGNAEFYATHGSISLNNLTLAGRLALRTADAFNGAFVWPHNFTLQGGVVSFYGFPRPPEYGPNAYFWFRTNETVGGTGEFVFEAGGISNGLRVDAATVTLGPGITVRTGTSGGGSIGHPAGTTGTVINQGTISAQTAGQSILLTGVINQGLIEVKPGSAIAATDLTNAAGITCDAGTLAFDGNWTNAAGNIQAVNGSTVTLTTPPAAAGTFAVSNSTLNLDGAMTTAALRAVAVSGSTINLTPNGVLNNAGDTLSLDPGNALTFSGGRINGGTISAGSTGGPVTVNPAKLVYFDGVTLAAPLNVRDQGLVRVNHDLLLDHSVVTISGNGRNQFESTGIQFLDAATLGGTGEVVFDGTPSQDYLLMAGNTLTIGPGITVRSGTAGGSIGGGNFGALVNQGLISAQTPGMTIAIGGQTFTNQGTLEAKNGGAFSFTNLTNSATINVTAPSSLTTPLTWTNAAGTINLNDAALVLAGSFPTSAIGTINRSGPNATVTLNGSMNNAGATLDLSQVGTLLIGPTAQITGGVVAGGPSSSASLLGTGPTSALTLNGVTLNAPVSLPSGGTLTFSGNWSNSGTITLNGATLNLNGTFTRAGLGTIVRTGGAVNLGGVLDNTGGTLLLDDSTGSWNIVGGTITGGTVRTAGSAQLTLNPVRPATFNALTLDADLPLNNAQVTVTGGLTLGASRQVTGNGSISFGGATPQTLDGAATLGFGTNTNNFIFNGSGKAVTFGPDLYIHAKYLHIEGSSGGIINRGTIEADAPDGVIYLSNVTNEGTIKLTGGSIRTNGSFVSSTPLEIQGGTLGGTGPISADIDNGGTLSPGNSIGTLTVSGDVSFTAGGHYLAELGPAGSSDLLKITGDLDLSGPDDYLDLTPVGTITPGSSFTVLTYTGNLDGVFDHVTPGYDVSYVNPNSIQVTATPEPTGAVVILGAGLIALARRRRP